MCIYIHARTRAHTNTHTHTHTHAREYIYICVYMYTYTYTNIYERRYVIYLKTEVEYWCKCTRLQRVTFHHLRGGPDKALARPTTRCRSTESIVSLERGVCSCAELQVFSCYRGWEEALQAKRAISTTSRRELLSSFFSLEGKAPKEIHAILTETLGERAPSHAIVKKWVVQFKRGDFFSLCRPPDFV